MDMDKDLVEMKVTLATVLERLASMSKPLEYQDGMIEEQNRKVTALISMADKGKGSVWMLITAAGFLGAVIANGKNIIQFFLK
ncbi:MAG: hypothetical protein ACRCU6_02855 [Fusobacteriaceae bacterium]